MLLLRGHGGLPLDHLHLHGARHKKLPSVLAGGIWLGLLAIHLLLLLLLELLLVMLLVLVAGSGGGRMLDLLLLLVVSDPLGW
jgi:hypothetical protein